MNQHQWQYFSIFAKPYNVCVQVRNNNNVKGIIGEAWQVINIR